MAELSEQQKQQRAKELAAQTKSQKALLKQAKRQLAMVFDLNKCLGCQTCTIACKTLWTRDEGMEYMWWATVNTQPGKGTPKDWEQDQGGGKYPNSFYFYLPRICNHCTNPACLEACPRNAIYKRKEDGIVLISEERCKGYRFCMEACPYKKIYFNHVRQIGQKCIFCYPRIEKGVAPACARQCPGRLRFVGFLDDESGPIHKLVKQWKVALPLHPEAGT